MRWISNIELVVSWIVRIVIGVAATICIKLFVVNAFSDLNPLSALLEILSFASMLVALFITIIEHGAPPEEWP
jgi:hypothetical protein